MDQRAKEISEAVKQILATVPPDVTLVAAAKGRTVEEVEAAIQAGITHVGHNYVQEARRVIPVLRDKATWHMIGHLQRNKVNAALPLFDMIETVDSPRLARKINERCAYKGRIIPVLIEVNSGRESNKTGVRPEKVEELAIALSEMGHIHLQGLMTMGPRFGDPEESRPYFQTTRAAFEYLSALNLPNVVMRYLSMGMSNSYQIAIEEGANVVRIGSKIFGRRPEVCKIRS